MDVKEIASRIRINKIVATRSVKSKNGDCFVGFSANYDSTLDEPAGAGKDLIGEESKPGGWTLREAKVAQYMLSMVVDTAAYEAAYANGGITQNDLARMTEHLKVKYAELISISEEKRLKHESKS